ARYSIDPDGCHRWQRHIDKDGYGTMRLRGVPRRAHRMFYHIFKGPIPEGILVCHDCDNPPCVNLEHLFLGTNLDNLADMVKKGRNIKGERCYLFGRGYLVAGERHGRARLKEAEARE